MRRISVIDALERILVGAPARPFADGSRVLAGRAQTGWGAWWGRHPRLLRCFALLAIAWTTAYIVWRIGWSLQGANPVLWAMLLVAEAYGLWGLAMLTWLGWRLPPSIRPPVTGGHAVDVYICTYDEPEAVLSATLAGCAALAYPHTTYLLDDGRRPEIAALAARWSAQYVTRGDNAHAKAGNINNALPITGGDLVLMLDADHVPLPDALDALIGYFDDERVAVVQTPHEFYNHDSIQHYEIGRHEQSVFYSVICPGKDRHNAAFWCGSGAVLRRSALLEVGGVAVETIAEDFHTTIKLHRAGWKTHYHDEVVVQGLAPHDLAAYLLQRDRWARGNLAVFTTPESPLRARELRPIQRLSYFASLSAYLAGPMRLLMLVTLAAVVWTGQLPLHATLLTLALLWAPATFLTLIAGSALCRGYQRIADTTHFELCTAQIFTRALRCVVRPGRTAFKVTPKEGVDLGGLDALRQLPWVVGLAAILAAGVAARILDESGVPLVPNLPGGVAFWVVPALGLFELRRVLRTLTLVARRRQRRIEYRMPLDTPVLLTSLQGAAVTGWARDISPSGLGLELASEIAPGTPLSVTAHVPSLSGAPRAIDLDVVVQSCRRQGATWSIGTSIERCSDEAARHIVEYCYVVSPSDRLRSGTPVALPAPFPIERTAPRTARPRALAA